MRLVLLVLGLAFAIGFLLKGSLKNLAELKLRYWGLALIGYGLQVFPYPESWGRDIPIAGLLLSFVILLAFALANIKQPSFILIALGILMNFTVIAANWGMPVSAQALINSDQEDVLAELRLHPLQKHHLASGDDRLRFLGDVIPIPDPIHIAVSIGDLVMYAGVGYLIVAQMRRSPPERSPHPDRSPPNRTGTEP